MSIDGLAWALLHSAWQGAVIAGLAGLALRVLHGSAAELRYRVLGGLLVTQLAWFLVTLVVSSSGAEPGGAGAVTLPPVSVVGPTWPLWLVAAWMLGVALLAARLVAGLWTTARWQRRSIAAPPVWLARFERLAARMGIDRAVALRLVPDGPLAIGPMAIGVIRPVVLVPAGLLVQLPTEQLEAILLHELAHVRRLDWAVNVAQSAAETLLFHHPATWWLSARIRHERELCCDAMAAAAIHDPLVYARALTELDALRSMPLAVAANGGHLMDRILRLVGAPEPHRPNPWVVPAVMIGVVLGGISVAARGTSTAPADAELVEVEVALDDAVAANDEDDADAEGRDRPVAAEDVGATVLDALADKLHEGARQLEAKAEQRHRRKHPDAAPVAPAPAPVAPLPSEAQVQVRVAPLPHADPFTAAADEAWAVPNADCQHVVLDGASVTVCDDGTVRVGTGSRALPSPFDLEAARSRFDEAARAAAEHRARRDAERAEAWAVAALDEDQWEAQAEAWAAEWEAQAEAWAAEWEAQAEAWEAEWEAQEEAWDTTAEAWQGRAQAQREAQEAVRELERSLRGDRRARGPGFAPMPPAPPAPGFAPMPPAPPGFAPMPPAPPAPGFAPMAPIAPDPDAFEVPEGRGRVPVEIEIAPLAE